MLKNYSVIRKSLTQRLINNSSINFESTNVAPPRNARVVICGGGVMGASVAYHLAKLGWGLETVLIEQNRFEELVQKLIEIQIVSMQDWGWNDMAFFRFNWRV